MALQPVKGEPCVPPTQAPGYHLCRRQAEALVTCKGGERAVTSHCAVEAPAGGHTLMPKDRRGPCGRTSKDRKRQRIPIDQEVRKLCDQQQKSKRTSLTGDGRLASRLACDRSATSPPRSLARSLAHSVLLCLARTPCGSSQRRGDIFPLQVRRLGTLF
ncbi:hypothetical protein IE81DRAFT_160177 [Ceraceosorus guamensis]|uniref:Uncharacterized protein n=1 Tax=Ceraceosorus guamensis TaxID=1522189 RepID=A0A316VW34_9BASI|nr:hypothetical protein IE81DRAFT_160177 [Ceraceosorus guamensis]PWN41679.1 hypothetical protein IE81DRAFT_160177 [Ceraceosorus guamensis]